MKLRTSFFNPTAFKKDVTRFAPAWVLYTVGLFMILTAVMMDNSEYYRANNLVDSLSFMAFINLCYGLLNGQLLFGDLFNARHCNALHAMPLRRECWFTTHVVSGLLFALVPNLLMSLVALPMLGGGWQVALWWLLAVMLQYLFFFGLAVFSALCVGNRFAMVLVYGIVNFFALIVYWFYSSIYQPLLYGVYISEESFLLWCPVWQMLSKTEIIEVALRRVETGFRTDYFVQFVAPGEGWGYFTICAVLGLVLLGVALALYRRRKMESAGDFMAVKALEPVFLVLYTLCMAAFFQVFAKLFGTEENVFLALGFVIGFFTGRMLLMRTTKVFQPKSFLWFGILAAAFILSMVLTWLDPLGVTRYIPDADDIKAVRVTESSNPQYANEPLLTEEADIEIVRQIHELVLDGQIDVPDGEGGCYSSLSLYYILDNGVTVTRRYDVACTSPAGQLVETLYTRPEFVLQTNDAEEFARKFEHMYFDDYRDSIPDQLFTTNANREYVKGLAEAILADCAEGHMAQGYSYLHRAESVAYLQFGLREVEDRVGSDGVYEWYNYITVVVYEDCRHTIAYIDANPFPAEEQDFG